MDNKHGRILTNYFRVTDIKKLNEILAKCKPEHNDKIQLFNKTVENGEKLYAFGCSSLFEGYYDPRIGKSDYDSFEDDLQTVVVPGDAIIIMEVGYEALKFVYGIAHIITREKTEMMDFTYMVTQKAAELLGNPDYKTIMQY
jgi:hypothetical protein